ncbi:MAG: LysR family transcriptional regulator [Oscillospiraceae bacterium]|nr:LysR family transcriptional regulator [Oscillospiraceae bacterium]MBO7422852.1 LysR family transcriptional regulator [Oscillospiraceae bacterium]MBO7727262.1 LysR family transcriptional regulator [Oscillospiraceae bacterium]
MDIRLMQYYLAVVREGTISAAAEALHVSQPALSRQMKDLEEELGVTLFQRGSRRITLTEEGMILRKRAEEMLRLMQLTEAELTQARDTITGEIHIGAGESHAFHFLSRAAGQLMQEHPGIRVHVVSGDTADLMDQLNNGLLDFALIFSEFDRSLYHSLVLPQEDRFGVLMRRDSALAAREIVTMDDLTGKPLLISRAADGQLWNGEDTRDINVVGTYNLIYNASLMVEDGLGYALCFDRLINVSGDSALCFRPLFPELHARGTLIWKRYQVLSPVVRLFIQTLRELNPPITA